VSWHTKHGLHPGQLQAGDALINTNAIGNIYVGNQMTRH